MSSRMKRNVTVVTTLVLVVAAVALNWKFSGREAAEEASEAGTKILGEAAYVSGSGEEAAAEEEKSGVDYFSSARLTRRQARDSALALLQEASEEENAAAAAQASESIQVLANYTLKEAQIENLVTAKGYADCVCFMGEDAISIVVATQSGELTAADVARITDIAVTESGYAASDVRIMAAK